MPVVNVGKMCVAVGELFVLMHMGVGLHAIPFEIVVVLVVFVMFVLMDVRHIRVRVFVRMMLGQMEPYPSGHQNHSNPEARASGLREYNDGDCSAHKRCR